MITVIGLGFVGLTTALGFSHKGYKIYGYDINAEKLKVIKKGKIPFFEPQLDEILKKNINKNFFIAENLKQAIQNSKVIFYCVGTPCDENGRADLTLLLKAIEESIREIKKGDFKLLVIKSTIPPSTTKEKITPFIESFGFNTEKDIGIVNNPEFLREGYAWEDFINPDRIVIGCDNEKSGKMLEDIYSVFNSQVFKVSPNTAEFIKYLSNVFLSTMISFSNEMYLIASHIGDIDIYNSFKILHLDRRWFGNPAPMTSYVFPGCGFGGYCLPKDTQALHTQALDKGYSSEIVKSVLETNVKIKEFIVNMICNNIDKNEYIGILGLSFKPDSDDVRESPAKDIIKLLLGKGYKIVAYDPLANDNFKKEFNLQVEYADSMGDLAGKLKNILILTGWKEFRNNKNLLKGKKVYDFRYILNE